jgi:poly(hydroxyalkanoate) depolymerase family esterase
MGPCTFQQSAEEMRGKRGRILAMGVMLAFLAALVLPATLPVPAAASEAGDTFQRLSLTNAAGTRQYLLYVPPGAPVQRPLVVELHGALATADRAAEGTHWNSLAKQKRFYVVYPEQDPDAPGGTLGTHLRSWNFGDPAHNSRDAGEASIIADIARKVISERSIDPHRVYVSGYSSGAGMSVVMAATYPDIFAAHAALSGCPYQGFPCLFSQSFVSPEESGALAYRAMGGRARLMPFFATEGTADFVLPPTNTEQVVQSWLAADDWADDGADNGSVPRTRSGFRTGAVPGGYSYEIDEYQDGKGHALGERWRIDGLGHTYSGGTPGEMGTDPKGPDITAASYEFFEAHPR